MLLPRLLNRPWVPHEIIGDQLKMNKNSTAATSNQASTVADQRAILEKCQQIPIFESIKDDQESMHELIKIANLIQVANNEPLIQEGHVGQEMYIVFSGAVEIKKLTRAGDEYTVVKLHADQNVFFGELALVDNDTRSATVRTIEESQFLVIHKKDFENMGKRFPYIALQITSSIARILAKRLRKTTSDMLTIFDALVQELSA